MQVQITRISKKDSKDPQALLPRFEGWLHERFGEHFAQICTFVTLKLKSSVRDVARMRRVRCVSCGAELEHSGQAEDGVQIDVCDCGGKMYGFVPKDIEILAKRFKIPPQGVSDYDFVMGYENDSGFVKGSKDSGHENSDAALMEYIERYPEDWDIVQKCLGLSRQVSRHACAYIISDKKVSDFIPLTSISGVKCTQYTAEGVEGVGGLKMDFLVITSLKHIQTCIKMIQGDIPFDSMRIDGKLVPGHRIITKSKSDNTKVDIWDLPEDQEVFKEIAEGKTETVFQFKTESAVGWLSYFNVTKPDGNKAISSIEDMAAFTALDRPGPLDIYVKHPSGEGKHNMLVEYARRAAGKEGSPEVLDVLDKLVPETHSILTYQEQLQRIYKEVTGCSAAEAEEFRVYVSKKKMSKVDECYKPFIERASQYLGSEEDAEALWGFIKTWGQYGFNKSHAVCYAVIAYACAYLKYHYPMQWWCSVLMNTPKDKINGEYWRHCQDFVKLPDIQLSSEDWAVQGDFIRAPISLLNGIGETAHKQLCENAPYSSIQDFTDKIIKTMERGKHFVTKKDKDTGEITKSLRWGRSALNRGNIKKLIFSGAMDSLFEQDLTIGEKIDVFEQALKKSHDDTCICVGRHSNKGKCQRKKYTKDPDEIPVLDSVGRFQMRKSVLPAFSEDIRLLFSGELPEGLIREGESLRYPVLDYNRRTRVEKTVKAPLCSPNMIRKLLNKKFLDEEPISFAALGYVEDTRIFEYGANKEKEAIDLTLDLCGVNYNVVHWPDESGQLPHLVKNIKKGTVVAVYLNKYADDKPYALRNILIVREPLKKTEKVKLNVKKSPKRKGNINERNSRKD